MENESKPILSHSAPRVRHRIYDAETKEAKRIRRQQQGQRPLDKLIRNASARAKAAWDAGLFGRLAAKSIPLRKGTCPSFMHPCTYYAKTGEVKNGYEIRLVKTSWSPLVAVWGFEGVVCVPIQFVGEGHSTDIIVPSQPPVCNQCDTTTYSHVRCTHCGAPLFYPTNGGE